MLARGRTLIAVSIVAGCLLMPSVASAGITQETVTVGSGGKVEVKSDLLKVHLGVQSQGRTADRAEDALARKAGRVVNALKGAGFKNIETTDVHISRRFEKGEFVGYAGSLSIKVQTGRVGQAGEIIDLATGAGASVRGVSFDVKDKSQAIQQALAEAMEFAKAKARTLAVSADRELGRALKIQEGSTAAPRAVRLEAASDESGGGGGGGGTSFLPVKPPMLDASARIRVTFELI